MTLNRRLAAMILGLMVLVPGMEPPAFAQQDGWRAGAAKVNITPEQPMWMAGYAARTKPAEGKMTDLWAKALVLQDGAGNKGVLITLDLVGIDRGLSVAICEQLQKKYQLHREQIAINCSHTHSGPVVAMNLRPMHEYAIEKAQQELVHRYAERLVANVVEAVGQALAKLVDARLAWGNGDADFAVNRRQNKEADVPKLRADNELKGPNDHNVPVLSVCDEGGRQLAIVAGYACHATVLDKYDWSGDYPGFYQIEMEKAFPGAIAMFWAGCGADQNPIPRRQPELAEKYGKQLASAVNEVLQGQLAPIRSSGRLTASYQEIPLRLVQLPTRDDLEAQTKDKNKYIAMRARMLLEEMDQDKPLRPTYPYPVQLWRLGDEVQWFFLGGEVVVDFALRIKAEQRGFKTWVAGYSNDVMAYIPSRRVLLEGGYEGGGAMVYYGLPTVWSQEVEEQIITEVTRQAAAK